MLTLSAGCSQLIDPNVPEPIRPFVEPVYGGEYLLYRPVSYKSQSAWPLVVVCHTTAGDSPNKQIRDWTQLAEAHRFLVIAPRLEGNASIFSPKLGKQLALQRSDEKRILSAIQHVRAGHNIAQDRIFIHGYSGGAYAALHTGLRNPEIFRAISLGQPKFNPTFLRDVGANIDPHQFVFLHAPVTDRLYGGHGRECAGWLLNSGVHFDMTKLGRGRKASVEHAVSFYERIVRDEPWVHICAFPTDDANRLAVQFKVRTARKPTEFLWDFGDGESSPVAAPIHTYAKPGAYRVRVTVRGLSDTFEQRQIELKVPEIRYRCIADGY